MNRYFVAFATALFAFCLVQMSVRAADTVVHSKDSIETIKKNVESGKAVLVDVREPKEWDAGHLKAATHVPLKMIFKGLSDEEVQQAMPADKIVYFHCASGVRSLDAARKLKERHPDLRPLKQGYESLLKAGFAEAQ